MSHKHSLPLSVCFFRWTKLIAWRHGQNTCCQIIWLIFRYYFLHLKKKITFNHSKAIKVFFVAFFHTFYIYKLELFENYKNVTIRQSNCFLPLPRPTRATYRAPLTILRLPIGEAQMLSCWRYIFDGSISSFMGVGLHFYGIQVLPIADLWRGGWGWSLIIFKLGEMGIHSQKWGESRPVAIVHASQKCRPVNYSLIWTCNPITHFCYSHTPGFLMSRGSQLL